MFAIPRTNALSATPGRRVLSLVPLVAVLLFGTPALAGKEDGKLFRSKAVGSTLNLSVPEGPGDVFPASSRLDGKGDLGKFALDTFGRTQFLTGDQDVCGGSPPAILANKILDLQAVVSFTDGSQILGLIDDLEGLGAGTICVSSETGAFRNFFRGAILGGTGRFAGATGSFEGSCSGFGIFELSSLDCDLALTFDSKVSGDDDSDDSDD